MAAQTHRVAMVTVGFFIGALPGKIAALRPRNLVRNVDVFNVKRPVDTSVRERRSTPRPGRSPLANMAGAGFGRSVDAHRRSCVLIQLRSNSATPQAWATHPRGVNGGSASKTSLTEPMS